MLSVSLILILFSTGILSSEVFFCENNNLNISCPSAQSIHIDYAFFGRNNRVTCPKSGYDQNTQCSSNNATEVLRQRCEAQQNCTVPASTQVFGDPCRGVYKFLQVNYTCVTQEVMQVLGCWNKGTVLSLTCPTTSIIHIASADFERHSTTTCPYPNPDAMKNTNCSLDETQEISQECNGKQNCVLAADNQIYDPCYGTYKYFTVNYFCSQVPAGIPTQVIGCDAQRYVLSLGCSAGTVIQITSVDYGRHSSTLCPYFDPHAMQNTQCSYDETARYATQCNGLQTCAINVDDQPHDPCYGTYKYLTVNYICVVVNN